MKRLIPATVVVLVLCALPVLSHHAAQGIVDEEVYEMIEALIVDTPHAEWSPPEEMGGGLIETVIATTTARPFETLLDGGLFIYLGMLDGEVVITMTFNRRGGVELLIRQMVDEP